jgi:hypothetical protein
MSVQSRLKAAAKALRKSRPRGYVAAMQWGCTEPPELQDKYMCPEFDGLGSGFIDPFTVPPEWYHWTRAELEAEAERRNVELMLVEWYDASTGSPPT